MRKKYSVLKHSHQYEDVVPLFTHIIEFYENLPRKIFLGLLKNCSRFITNSSCAYYEAPAFLKPEQIIIVGKRNKRRSSSFSSMGKGGSSDKIIKILEKYFKNEN